VSISDSSSSNRSATSRQPRHAGVPRKSPLRRAAQLAPALAGLPEVIDAVLLDGRPHPLQPTLPELLVRRCRDDDIDQRVHRLIDRVAEGAGGAVHVGQRRPDLLHQHDGAVRRDQRIDAGNRLDLGERLLEPLRG
jgi:hypothetical protein